MHIPISENRIAQFAANFEPHNDGYVYYGDRYLGGLPLDADERDGYIENFANVLRNGNRVLFAWVISAAVATVIAEEGYDWQTTSWQRVLVFILPLPWVMWTSWRSRQIVLEGIGRRMPVTPPRTYGAGVASRVAAFPVILPIAMIGIGVVLLVQQWRYGLTSDDIGGDALGVGVIAFGVWALWLARRRQHLRR